VTKNITEITPQYKLSGGSWATIPTVVTRVMTSREQIIQMYNPINSTAPTVIKMTASPSWSWELEGICTSSTDLDTIDTKLAPGRTASFKCSTATPGIPIIVTNLEWREVGGQVGIYRYILNLTRTD